MYSVFAVDPAVSCKKNRSSLMNFPIIWVFPKRSAEVHANPLQDMAEIVEYLS